MMIVFVNDLEGNLFQFNMTKDSTITSLKFEVSLWSDIPADDIRLILDGRELNDQTTLLEAGVKPCALIHLVSRAIVGGTRQRSGSE